MGEGGGLKIRGFCGRPSWITALQKQGGPRVSISKNGFLNGLDRIELRGNPINALAHLTKS